MITPKRKTYNYSKYQNLVTDQQYHPSSNLINNEKNIEFNCVLHRKFLG
jgi:hypothetical protein